MTIGALHDDRLLLVEGATDRAVLLQLLAKHGLAPPQHSRLFRECDGFGDLQRVASVSLKTVRRLGIIIDHDEPEDARWTHLRAALADQGCSLPLQPVAGGTIGRGARDDFTVGVWVMPDNAGPGMLEHFLATLVPEDQRGCWTHACDATAAARRHGARYNARHLQKAEMHTWLAWQDPPGLALGHALRQNIFAADSDVAQQFVAWYRTLFVTDP